MQKRKSLQYMHIFLKIEHSDTFFEWGKNLHLRISLNIIFLSGTGNSQDLVIFDILIYIGHLMHFFRIILTNSNCTDMMKLTYKAHFSTIYKHQLKKKKLYAFRLCYGPAHNFLMIIKFGGFFVELCCTLIHKSIFKPL